MYQQLVGDGSFCGHYIIVKLMTMKMITVTMMGVGSNDISKDASSELCFSSHCHGNHFSFISVNSLMKFAGHLKVERSCAEAVLRMPLK